MLIYGRIPQNDGVDDSSEDFSDSEDSFHFNLSDKLDDEDEPNEEMDLAEDEELVDTKSSRDAKQIQEFMVGKDTFLRVKCRVVENGYEAEDSVIDDVIELVKERVSRPKYKPEKKPKKKAFRQKSKPKQVEVQPEVEIISACSLRS